MSENRLRCLECKENIAFSVGEGEEIIIFCVANNDCAEREDKDLFIKKTFNKKFLRKELEILFGAVGLPIGYTEEL